MVSLARSLETSETNPLFRPGGRRLFSTPDSSPQSTQPFCYYRRSPMRSPRLRRHAPSEPKPSSPKPLPEGLPAGEAVEVLPDQHGYRGPYLAAVVASFDPDLRTYTVDYDARPVRESVPAQRVRPRPPPSPTPPAEHAAVDALRDGAWWLGVALQGGGREDGRVAVCFTEAREVMEFDAADVRPHLEWVDGVWRSPEDMDVSKKTPYTKGTRVEFAKFEDSSVVAWFPAVVNKTIWMNQFLVDCTCQNSADNTVSQEVVHLNDMRPCPPHASTISFCINDEVEGFQGDGWWLGVITEVHPELIYTFKLKSSGKEVQLEQKALRLRYDWVDGQWKQVSKNLLQMELTEGIKVEISSNDEGFRGAWFQGTIRKPIAHKFMVEYDTLKDDDEITPLTEAIEVQHIRPCPPDIPVINGFKIFDEVDAFCNDGWWVGMIFKVLSDQRYMVYFKSYNEVKEFGHEQLRLHCDWLGGRWMRANLALET